MATMPRHVQMWIVKTILWLLTCCFGQVLQSFEKDSKMGSSQPQILPIFGIHVHSNKGRPIHFLKSNAISRYLATPEQTGSACHVWVILHLFFFRALLCASVPIRADLWQYHQLLGCEA